MSQDTLQLIAKGHCQIVDDLGNVLLEKDNAIHPQNMARVFARALSKEANYYIYRMAFGNGGTYVDASLRVSYRTPNDGQPPDVATWDSRLYNETYSEIVDDGDPANGCDPGSADINTGTRPGGGALCIPENSVESRELGLTSDVIVKVILSAGEPFGQFPNDTVTNTDFVFDEIGLYTTGLQAIATSGYQQIDVGNRTAADDTGLVAGASYQMKIQIDGGTAQLVSFTTPIAGGSGVGGEILYGDLCEAFNTGLGWSFSVLPPLPGGAKMLITDYANSFSTIPVGTQTYGFLMVQSPTTGPASTVEMNFTETNSSFLPALNPPTGAALLTAVDGKPAGVQNDVNNPQLERERLLAHLIFSPILKAADRTLTITYTLTMSVARTPWFT